MDKKQLYIIMAVSVLLLFGIMVWNWIGGKKGESTPPKKKGPPQTKQVGKAGSRDGSDRPKVAAERKKTSRESRSVAKVVRKGGHSAVKTAGSAGVFSIAERDLRSERSLKKLLDLARIALDRQATPLVRIAVARSTGLAKSPGDLRAVAELTCQAGLYQEAEKVLALIKAARPPAAYTLALARAFCLARRKQFGPAGAALMRAIVLARSPEQRTLAKVRYCGLLVEEKKINAARQRCKEAVASGFDPRGMVNLARLELLENSTSPQAVENLKRAHRLDPSWPRPLILLAEVREKAGDKQAAAKHLVRAGRLLLEQKLYHRALAVYRRAALIAPGLADPSVGIAEAQQRLGAREKAIVAFRQAAKLAKGDVSIRISLARLLGEKELLPAIRVLEEARQIDPAHEGAKKALAAARKRLADSRPKRLPERITRLEGRLLRMSFTTRGGVPRSIILKKERYQEEYKKKRRQVNLVRTWSSWWLPLRMVFDGSSFPFPGRFEGQDWDRLRWNGKGFDVLGGKDKAHAVRRGKSWVFGYRWPVRYPGMAPPPVVVERIYGVDPDRSYHWDMEIRVVNHSARKQVVKLKLLIPTVDKVKEERSFFNPISLQKEAVCMVGDKVYMRTLQSFFGSESGCLGCDASACACRRTPAKGTNFSGRVMWAGIDEMYFLFAVVPNEKNTAVCSLTGRKTGVLLTTLTFSEEAILHKGSKIVKNIKVFTGPKLAEKLDQVGFSGHNPKLGEAIDYGLFWFLGQPMMWLMRQIQKVVGNWGIAIILLTLLIKLLTLPFTVKQMRSMKGMAKLKPEMDRLKEKYGEDKQRFQQEMWALYKAHKINPLGGCLPMLLQMPIYIAWYQALMVSVDLYRAPLFGWITDLTKPDTVSIAGFSVPILPLIMGATMFLQQRMTPTPADNAQAKMMMYMMPAMFTFFLLFLPSGLTLYILTNTVLSMMHQWYMNHSD